MYIVRLARLLALLALFLPGPALAQQNVWVQIEALRSEGEALARAQDYASYLQGVNGYRLRSGWHALALGPFAPDEAAEVLRQLRITRQIPGDSYIVDGGNFRGQFYAATGNFTVPATPEATETAPQAEAAAPAPLIPPEETLAEARRSEAELDSDARQLLQRALQWEGFYTAAIDGAFGPGTRNSMADWQLANNFEPTGVLTTRQRDRLVGGYQDMLASMGLRRITDTATGIEIDLPMAMIAADGYEPPFGKYRSTTDDKVQVMLISQTGDEATLAGLFDILQTLEIMPLDGPRELGARSFELTGISGRMASYAHAELADGRVKGFLLVWPDATDRRREVVLTAMRQSFAAIEGVLPDVLGSADAGQSADLLAGLAIRRPTMTQSGFFVAPGGAVLTTAHGLGSCERITLNDEYAATLAAQDSGLALLQPQQTLAPMGYARLQPGISRLNAEVAVSGFSYDGALGAPTLTFGTLTDNKGLRGEPMLKRLALSVTPSDVGGPVFDRTGAVMGILLPGDRSGGQLLPADVNFAADASAITAFLSANGIAPAAAESFAAMAPEDLTLVAADMTVEVSCWN